MFIKPMWRSGLSRTEYAKIFVWHKIQEHLENNFKNEKRKRELMRSKVAHKKIASWYAEGEKDYDTKQNL